LHNLGPKSALRLAEIGDLMEDDPRTLGAVEAYARLRLASAVGLNTLHAMYASVIGCEWPDLSDEVKRKHRLAVGHE
jgi:hypothetical protein